MLGPAQVFLMVRRWLFLRLRETACKVVETSIGLLTWTKSSLETSSCFVRHLLDNAQHSRGPLLGAGNDHGPMDIC